MQDAGSAVPEHEGEIVVGSAVNVGAPAAIGVLAARFVRYPGCQQLTLWLPQSGYGDYGDLRVLGEDGAVIEQATVRARLNGSVQILWDTLSWPPGAYRIEIDHAGGWRHELALRKLEAGQPAPLPPLPPEVEETSLPQPRIYRDGFGNVLPDVDLLLREKALANIARQFSRHLEYEGNFRAGVIIYVDGAVRIRFQHEMCGGEVKFAIDVPTVAQWESATGVSLAERDEIVRFVAEQVQREQASTWRVEIFDDAINFY